MTRAAGLIVCLLSASILLAENGEPLPGTQPLMMEGDIAAQLVDGVDKFLLRKLNESVAKRERHWKRDFSSKEAYEKSIEPNRKRLAHILGVRDERVKFAAPELVATTEQPALVGKGENYDIFAVRWPAVRDVHGEGLLLVPKGKAVTDIIAIPDADQTPEQLCGLAEGLTAKSQFARRLAEVGCRVLVPTLIDRQLQRRNAPGREGGANLSNREYLYRPSFELGRHLIGYELQKVLAGVDWMTKDAGSQDSIVGVLGYGEGGMLALYAGALDPRIDSTGVAGFFGPREGMWQEPLDRNVFGLLDQFGAAELASMIAPRALTIESGMAPEVTLPSEGGAPAKLTRVDYRLVAPEFRRISQLLDKSLLEKSPFFMGSVGERIDYFFGAANLKSVLQEAVTSLELEDFVNGKSPSLIGAGVDASARHRRQMNEIERDTQYLLSESPYVRAEFMKNLDTSSVEAYQKSVEPYREIFAKEIIGQFDDPLLEPKPRTRKTYDNEKWTGYEVVLDVFPDVIAYGILCVPKDLDLSGKEQRPVVVCQHGLEGRPQDVIGEQNAQYYSGFAGKLAEQGFITFAPQNLYIGKDRFRTLQRKANPLGKTLFSVIVPQHQQIVNWLSSLPYVDKERIAFYGLSYGGKSAMRIPPLVKNYCLSICSADFNEWVDKNASTRGPYSYAWTGEYEIFEFDLGSTFNYAEMAALICPRPFMVERGHFDGVGTDEKVAYEYAKVQHLYAARLKIPNECAIEWFDGPHKINGVGTYEFLKKKLNWPGK